MNIIEYIKNKLDPKNCPKHDIPYYRHGYYDLKACELCDEERWSKLQNDK